MAARIFLVSPCWCYGRREAALPKSSPTISSTTGPRRQLLARASNPPPQQEEDPTPNTNSSAFSSPDDLNYLWKLVIGSIGGAAVIKYGSVLFPDITSPNILLALVMITLPVVVSVIVLIKESTMSENKDPI